MIFDNLVCYKIHTKLTMTVKGLKTILCEVPSEDITYSEIRKRNLKVAVDASWFLWRSFKGVAARLTSEDGRVTGVYIPLIAAIREFGPTNLIFVFDNPDSNPAKKTELELRKKTRDNVTASEEAPLGLFAAMEEESETIAHSAAETLPVEAILAAKEILDFFGVTHVESQQGVEAEALASWLTISGEADVVYSNDGDCFAFGAKAVLKPIKGKSGKFNLQTKKDVHKYVINTVLVNANKRISDTLAKLQAKKRQNVSAIAACVPIDLGAAEIFKIICMSLGTDWDRAGIKGVGPAANLKKFDTVLSSWKSDTYSNLRDLSKEYDISPSRRSEVTLFKAPVSVDNCGFPVSYTPLTVWLLAADFQQATITKIVDKLKAVSATKARILKKVA